MKPIKNDRKDEHSRKFNNQSLASYTSSSVIYHILDNYGDDGKNNDCGNGASSSHTAVSGRSKQKRPEKRDTSVFHKSTTSSISKPSSIIPPALVAPWRNVVIRCILLMTIILYGIYFHSTNTISSVDDPSSSTATNNTISSAQSSSVIGEAIDATLASSPATLERERNKRTAITNNNTTLLPLEKSNSMYNTDEGAIYNNLPKSTSASYTSYLSTPTSNLLQDTAPFDFEEIVKTFNLSRAFPKKVANIQEKYANGEEEARSVQQLKWPWCVSHETYSENKPTGMIYVKVRKTASSTTAGIATRIAYRIGGKIHGHNITQNPIYRNKTERCQVNTFHTHARDKVNSRYWHGGGKHIVNHAGYFYSKRDINKSFMMATIRHPSVHAISEIFYEEITRHQYKPTDRAIIYWLKTQRNTISHDGHGGYQLSYASMETLDKDEAWAYDKPKHVKNTTLVIERVRNLMNDYDFLIDVDSYDESLVVLQLLLDLEPYDILYLPSKGPSASYTKGNSGTCLPKIKSFISPKVQEYLNSSKWHAQNYGDFLLYESVKQSLDRTIDEVIGRDVFNKALDVFLKLKDRAFDACYDDQLFPCDSNGKKKQAL